MRPRTTLPCQVSRAKSGRHGLLWVFFHRQEKYEIQEFRSVGFAGWQMVKQWLLRNVVINLWMNFVISCICEVCLTFLNLGIKQRTLRHFLENDSQPGASSHHDCKLREGSWKCGTFAHSGPGNLGTEASSSVAITRPFSSKSASGPADPAYKTFAEQQFFGGQGCRECSSEWNRTGQENPRDITHLIAGLTCFSW